MILSLLVAADENNLIGKDNHLPWHLPNDLRYFKNLTWAMPIVMGRKTFESIGKPLPGRRNIVVTRNGEWSHEGVDAVHSIDAAMAAARADDVKEVFVIGGDEIYRASLQLADRVYLTRIHHAFDGDVYFPTLSAGEWTLEKETHADADEKNAYPHTFQVWKRH